MAEGDHVDISEEVNPSVPTLSQPPQTHAPPPLTPTSVLPAYSAALPTHLPPPASSGAPLPPASPTSAATNDQARIAALVGTVNQMATNMAKLLALLRGPNRASSSSTPPTGPGPTVDPTPWAPPTQAPENVEAPAPPTLYTSTVHPFTSQLPPPPAPSVVPLPPVTFLSSEHILSAPSPVSIPAPAMAYTAPPPINTTFHKPGTQTHAAQFASPTHFFPEADAEQERRLKMMEETIRALQAGDARPDARHGDCSLSGSALDWFMSLKAEDIPTWEDLSRKFTDQYRYCAETPPTLLELSTKEMARGQKFEEYAAKWRAQAAKHIPPISEAQQIQLFHSTLRGVTSQPTQQAPSPQGQQGGAAQPRPRRQYPALPVPLSHIYRQIRDKVGTMAPSPNFDPTIQDQSKQCEYHRGAPGHTLDNCWKLKEKIQEMMDAKELVFNAGPSINMITVCTSSEGEGEQGWLSPFVIEYVPAEAAVGFAEIDAPHAPLVIDVPARKPYSNDRVPWTYEGDVGNLEQQFGVMGITCSGRLYENPATTDKGKAPATEMNVDLNRIRPNKTAVRAFDGSRREVNGEIDLLIDIDPCSFSVTFQVLDIPNAFSLLLGRPWIHSAGAIPSSLHQKVKFIVEERIITVKGEEDYALYKETAVPYISVGDDKNLPFHSFRDHLRYSGLRRGRAVPRRPHDREGPGADVRSKPNAINAGPEPDAGPGPDAGPKPNEINVGSEPDAELVLYAINAGSEPDVGSKPNAVNAGPEPDAGPGPDAGPKPDAINAGLIGKCKKCESKEKTHVARGSTRWTIVGVGLKACMEAQHDAWFDATGTVLSMAGGSQLKGVNSLKSSEDL
ncbi:hypothetical protein CRG98_028546 [Punica granatum]|uniref:Retrotransposon gag domain-containing protein n=1 Tax=Punica granatum TaxID=22663 RepID=A0A2I0J4A7_PUNGR|nr:hypothetical protein CRG98_028546 [Punica granatum]